MGNYRDNGMTLEVDAARAVAFKDATGLYVRAVHDGAWGSHDIATLRRDSLEQWLQDRDTAVNVVAILLGHRRAG